MTVSGVSQASEISEFVHSVRTELADLPALTADDLVDGLRADLSALVDDSGLPLHRVVSTPARYAAELRAAAGLPPPSGSERPRRSALSALLAVWRASPLAALLTRDTALRREFMSFCRAVVPAWWVIRGLTFAAVTNLVVNTDDFALALLHLGFVVLSVEVGRRHRFDLSPAGRRRLDRGLDIGGGLLFVLMLPLFFDFLSWGFSGARTVEYRDSQPVGYDGGGMADGVFGSGYEVGNLFVFDQSGDLVEDARIVDHQGSILELPVMDYVDPVTGDYLTTSDYQGPTGSSRGVFPLEVVAGGWEAEAGLAGPDSRSAPVPVRSLPPLVLEAGAGGQARTGPDAEPR